MSRLLDRTVQIAQILRAATYSTGVDSINPDETKLHARKRTELWGLFRWGDKVFLFTVGICWRAVICSDTGWIRKPIVLEERSELGSGSVGPEDNSQRTEWKVAFRDLAWERWSEKRQGEALADAESGRLGLVDAQSNLARLPTPDEALRLQIDVALFTIKCALEDVRPDLLLTAAKFLEGLTDWQDLSRAAQVLGIVIMHDLPGVHQPQHPYLDEAVSLPESYEFGEISDDYW